MKRPRHPQRNQKDGVNPTPDDELKEAIKNAEHFADDTLNFWHAFVASVSVIIVSELGDKTFFIAAIMAMRHSR